ncbi:TPA: hypothetical protein H6V66_003469 [Escherichia coli]|nr:hypothetical protein [Escherichia coli]EFN8539304.1 hypothetical protein [Escherichia coli O117]EFH4957694.1 hypothetical protein [Escherichia coli]EFH8339889.1 hypothetical protein [Escherichia coli]EFI1504395.1 hypothetical protein [Escherichia coli]
MTTITRENAEIKSFITGFLSDPAHDNQSSDSLLANVFRIALASLEAEPVAWKATFTQIDHEYNTFTDMYSDKAEVERCVRLYKVGDFRADITPLYAAPPAQAQCIEVAVNDDMAYAFHHALSDSSPGADEVEEIKIGLRAAFANVTVQLALIVPDEIEPDDSNTFDYVDGWNTCRAAMLQAGNFRENKNSSTNNFREISETSTSSLVTPDGWVMVPKRLTAENGAKGALSGEFSETTFISCPECFGDDDCDTCDGSGRIEIKVPVTWTTIKSIWDKGIAYFAAEPPQEVNQ